MKEDNACQPEDASVEWGTLVNPCVWMSWDILGHLGMVVFCLALPVPGKITDTKLVSPG